eukprot:3236988-Rhodomonas_salina.1
MALRHVESAWRRYGDLYPVTHLGRGFAGLSAVAGVLATSLLTAALIKALTRTSQEDCAFNFLRSLALPSTPPHRPRRATAGPRVGHGGTGRSRHADVWVITRGSRAGHVVLTCGSRAGHGSRREKAIER